MSGMWWIWLVGVKEEAAIQLKMSVWLRKRGDENVLRGTVWGKEMMKEMFVTM